MNSSPPRRWARREETRAELVAAATAEFLERGYPATTVGSVARRAGFTTGAIYGHFADKDALFLTVYEAYARSRAEEIAATLPEGTLAERATALAQQWSQRHAAAPEFTALTLEFAARAIRNPTLREAFAARHATVRVLLAQLLEDAAAAEGRRLPLPATDLAVVFRDLGIGLALGQLLDPDAAPPGLFADFTRTVFDGVGADA